MQFVMRICHNAANLGKKIVCGLPAQFKLKTGLTF